MGERRDLRAMEGATSVEGDVCIIGTGPAGIAVASELAGSAARVILLEGGGEQYEPESQALYAFESVGRPWGWGDTERRIRALGGTSTVWTGRCAPFDAIDFRRRAWIPNSGWPLSRRDLDPYLDRAAALLRLGPNRYDDSAWARFGVEPPQPPLDPGVLRTQLWQYSQAPDGRYVDVGRDVLPELADAPNVSVILHANVTRVRTADGAGAGAVEGVEAATLDGKYLYVHAPVVVLACGGIENARLLLASNGVRPNGLGNEHDCVGRYLMDHPSPVIGTYLPGDARAMLDRFGHYWLDDERGRHVYYAGLALTERAQMERGLPNVTAYLHGEARDDTAVLALRRLRDAVRAIPDARHLLRDVFSVARGPSELLDAAARRAQHRPEILPMRGLHLVCNPEQIPNPESRVTLSDRRDALGQPIARVDWRVDERERDAAVAMIGLVRRELARIGLPVPAVPAWVRGEEDWRPSFGDVAHPMGTTRMSDDPKHGVVDARCEVHDTPGLYVAGSSVFATSGTANPTLMICALAARLGEHLRERVTDRAAPEVRAGVTTHRPRRTRVRVGVIGASDRAKATYLPVLDALADRLELAGVATPRPDESLRDAVPAFRSVEEMVQRTEPDLLISLEDGAPPNASVTDALLDFGLPLLVETPLASSLRDGRALARRVREVGVPVGVAERMPYLPEEELKAMLLAAGVFGRVLAAHNDRHSLEHHGIAQLRRYLGAGRRAREASAMRGACELTTGRIRGRRTLETWEVGQVRYDDGAMLHHQLGGEAFRRIPGTLRIHGERASMMGTELRLDGQAPVRVVRHESERDGARFLDGLSVELPDIGEVRWDNPYRRFPLNDAQIAVASHLDAMRRAVLGEGEPLYDTDDALRDVESLRAMQISAALSGAPVALPVSVTVEGLRLAARPSVWLDRLREMEGPRSTRG